MKAAPSSCLRAGPCLLVLVLLAACGDRIAPMPPPVRVTQADQPAAPPQAPDTGTMGAGPDTSTMGAAPSVPSCGIATMPQEILQRVNAARAGGRRCGGRTMPPAGPLSWDSQLLSAAASHSQDMARRNYFDHRSPEGVMVSQRASASRYKWKSVGENIAGGDTSVNTVVNGWLDSPTHCENMMDGGYQDIAVACVQQPGTQWGTYWTMVLGRKQGR